MMNNSFLMTSIVVLAACEVACAAPPVTPDPCKMEFKLIGSRRYMLDNELPTKK